MIMLFRRILVTMQNYMDIENGEEYWFPLKKKEVIGIGLVMAKIMIDRRKQLMTISL